MDAFSNPLNDPLVAAAVPEMSREVLSALRDINAVAIRQDFKWQEEIFDSYEPTNKYKVSVLPDGVEDKNLTDNEVKMLPMLYDVRENSTVFSRFFYGNKRPFKLGFFPQGTPQIPKWPTTSPLMSLDRPFRRSFWCGKLYNPQQIWVSVGSQQLGHVEQECRCVDYCFMCTHWARSLDVSGMPIHTFRSPFCGEMPRLLRSDDMDSVGNNCCAPSCCNPIFTIDVLNPDDESKVLGVIENIWPGWNSRAFYMRRATNFVLRFPRNATEEDKALLMASLFLHDFMYFETRKTRNDDD